LKKDQQSNFIGFDESISALEERTDKSKGNGFRGCRLILHIPIKLQEKKGSLGDVPQN
jgi:hypothetical protein